MNIRPVPSSLSPGQAVVVAPRKSPWLQAPTLPVHVASTVVVMYGPGILRAADAPPRR
jgi:hypothetical protein